MKIKAKELSQQYAIQQEEKVKKKLKKIKKT